MKTKKERFKIFDEIIGHEEPKKVIEEIIKNKKLTHALLFSGPSGVGKSLMAKNLARAIVCESNEKIPCGECISCHQVIQDIHPDIHWIRPEGKANKIRLESILNIQSKVHLKPLASSCQVIILNDAHTMNAESQNALLKILEEPPKGVYWILVTHQVDLIFATVLSRCQKIRFGYLSDKEQMQVLGQFGKTGENFEELMGLTEGNLGEAVSLTGEIEYQEALDLFWTWLTLMGSHEVVDVSEGRYSKEFEQMLLEIGSRLLRDVMLCKCIENPEPRLFLASRVSALKEIADKLDLDDISQAFQAVIEAKKLLSRQVSSKLVFNQLLMQMKLGIVG